MTYVRLAPGLRYGTTNNRRDNGYTPPVDIVETDESYALELDVPGFSKDDLNISVNEGVLTVKGERKRNVETNEKHFTYFERPEGTFTRSFQLPDHVNGEKVTAAYSNGVLRLELPKKETAKPYTITIK